MKKVNHFQANKSCNKLHSPDPETGSPVKNGMLPIRMLSLSIVLILLTCTLLALTACSVTDPQPPSISSDETIPTTTADMQETTVMTTPEPTEVPAIAYTFDLSEDLVKKPDHQLAFISNQDQAVIFGGENSPYIIEGNFVCSEVDSMWSPATNISFHSALAMYRFAYSIDKTSIVFIVRKENPIINVLMYFDGSKASEVSPDSEYFCISSDGSSVAYVLDDKLYVWDASSKESTLITDNATSNFVLSPSGKYIGYAKGDDFTCFIAPVGGDSFEIGSSCYPVALTDDGSVFYYYDASGDDTAFSVFSSGSHRILKDHAVIKDSNNAFDTNLIFNRDCTQVVYYSGEQSFFSMNGGEPVSVLAGSVVDTNPRYYVDDSFVRIQIAGTTYIAPYYLKSKNLCNVLFQNRDTLTFFDENFEVFTFPVSEYSEGVLSGNGRALSYQASDRSVDPPTEEFVFLRDFSDPESSKLIFSDLHTWSITMTQSGNLYYLNDVAQLFVIRGNEEPFKLDTYVYDFNIMTIGNASYIYYLRDETSKNYSLCYTLCRIEDAPGAQPEVIDTDVIGMDICDAGLVYYKNEELYDAGSWSKDIYFIEDGLTGAFVFTMSYFY